MTVRRSSLTIPGNNMKMMTRGAGSESDVIILDMEDSVPLPEKERARNLIKEAVNSLDFTGKECAVRINSVSTPFGYGDLITVCETGADSVIMPKVESVEEIIFVSKVLDAVERSRGSDKRTTIQVLIESARGIQFVDEISRASDRITAVIFGIGDYLADIGAQFTTFEDTIPVCVYPRSRVVVAAAAAGLDALDSVYPDFKDEEGLRADAQRGLQMGFRGKWVIHPAQIEAVNDVFTPGPEEIRKAKSIVEAHEKASAEGHGAISCDDQIVDEATIRISRKLVETARTLGLLVQVEA